MLGMNRFILCFLLLAFVHSSRAISEKSIQHDIVVTANQEKINITIDTAGFQQLFDLYLKTRKSNPYEALNYLNQAQIIASTINNKEKMALAFYHKGYLYRLLGIYNLAIKSYITSLEYFEK